MGLCEKWRIGGDDRCFPGDSPPELMSMPEVLSDISRSLSGSLLRWPLLSDFLRMDLERRWCSSWGLARLSMESTDREDLLPLFLPADAGKG